MNGIQMFDGDGVEPDEVRVLRLERERDERNRKITEQRLIQEACAQREAEKRAKLWKKQLEKKPLRTSCIRFDYEFDKKNKDLIRLKVLTDCPEDFKDLMLIKRPAMVLRYPEFNPHDTMRMPVVLEFAQPAIKKVKHTLLDEDAYKEDRIHIVEIVMTCKGITNLSTEAYAEEKKLHASYIEMASTKRNKGFSRAQISSR